MCGRFYLDKKSHEGLKKLGVKLDAESRYHNYNIAPSYTIPIIQRDDKGNFLEAAYWGLLPNWARAKNMKPQINARSETADTKPYFRSAFKNKRCLIPASGFYEWKRESNTKTPYAIKLNDSDIMAFAGLYEYDVDGNASCAILTTEANKQMSEVHHRMPVILHEKDCNTWLDEGSKDLMSPYNGDLEIWQISKDVNKPSNNSPSIVAPI